MKRQLFYLTNHHGFSLPYVLFITALSFIIITSNINIYQNEVYTMKHLTDQVNVETLIQMGTDKFKHDILKNKDSMISEKEISYIFPSGDVNIIIISNKRNVFKVRLYISTNQNTEFTIKSYISA